MHERCARSVRGECNVWGTFRDHSVCSASGANWSPLSALPKTGHTRRTHQHATVGGLARRSLVECLLRLRRGLPVGTARVGGKFAAASTTRLGSYYAFFWQMAGQALEPMGLCALSARWIWKIFLLGLGPMWESPDNHLVLMRVVHYHPPRRLIL